MKLSSHAMELKTTVTELPESRVRLAVEVPPEEVERRVHQAAREVGSKMRIPGFRRGKVPPPVVIRRLGREALVEEAVRDGLPRWYQQAVDEAGIAPVGDPELDVPSNPDQGQPFTFSFEIGVRPRAKLGPYKGLEVGRREPRADPQLLEQGIERLRDQHATLEHVERPAEQGDFIVVDYLGRADGKLLEGAEGRDQLLELGTGRLLPGFDEELVGASAGEQREVEITFPEDHPEDLRGRTATFEVTVKDVQAKRLPELDGEFAELAGFDSVDELREDIAKRLREADEEAVEREFGQAVVDAAVQQAEIEVPERLVHARAHELLEQTLAALERQGISKESYLRITGGDEERLAHEAEPEAKSALQREAVLAAVAEAEGLHPSDEELQRELAPLAQRDGRKPERVLTDLRRRGALEQFREDVASRQALELLVAEAKPIPSEQARAREKLWTPEKQGAEQPSGQLWTPGSES
ncbi:MAG: trigger factor [Solirubrobacterales bacterium]|nr:trigger factor [Solirubrobacterales bacterium]